MARAAWPKLLTILCGLAIAGTAAADEPLDLIPADSLLCWKGRPFPNAQPGPAKPSAWATLIDVTVRVAGDSLDSTQRLTARVFEGIGAMVRYPFAVALIDARAKHTNPHGTGSKVERLRIVAVIKTAGKSEPFRRVIQKVVNEQTDAGVATLEKKQIGRWTYQELRDSRLPDWCVVAWGTLGEHFVIALGDGVWPLVAAVAEGQAGSLSKDEWVTEIRQQRHDEPLIEIIMAAKDIRQRLDPFVQGRATAFFKAWHSGGLIRGYWALGFQDRALYCLGHLRTPTQTIRRSYADPNIHEPRFLQTIPDTSRYAIYRLEVSDYLPRLISGFYATRSEQERQAAADLWAQIQKDLGVDVQRDALVHLGDTIVLHNYPPHPLHLPLAFTSLIEIRREPAKVRRTLETLCAAWQAAIERAADESGVPNPAQLQRDDDGIWYLQIGPVASLAWTFTDRFIVTSWSPMALREYLDKIGDKAGKRTSAKK